MQTRPQDDALPPIGGIPERREQRHSSKPCQLAGFLNPKRESQERQLRPVALAREPVPMTRDRQRENPRHNSTEQRLPSGRGRSGSWSLLRLDRPRRARGSGEVFDRLDLPRLEHSPGDLEPIGEDDEFAFDLTAVLEDGRGRSGRARKCRLQDARVQRGVGRYAWTAVNENAQQHTIPATYIAGFSFDIRKKRRKSPVFVKRRDREDVKQRPASKLGRQHRIYDVIDTAKPHLSYDTSDPTNVQIYGLLDREGFDRLWQRMEQELSGAIRELVENREPDLSSVLWVAQFVASLFVRGPEFKERILTRLRANPAIDPASIKPDTHNAARPMELAMIVPAVLFAPWVLLEAPETGPTFITSDRGVANVELPGVGRGYLVPLTPRCALLLGSWSAIKPTVRLSSVPQGRHWNVGEIERRQLDDESARRINLSMWRWARDEVYSSTEQDVAFGDVPRVVNEGDIEPTMDHAQSLALSPAGRASERPFLKFLQTLLDEWEKRDETRL